MGNLVVFMGDFCGSFLAFNVPDRIQRFFPHIAYFLQPFLMFENERLKMRSPLSVSANLSVLHTFYPKFGKSWPFPLSFAIAFSEAQSHYRYWFRWAFWTCEIYFWKSWRSIAFGLTDYSLLITGCRANLALHTQLSALQTHYQLHPNT